ncbi:hypothetical protein [Desulfovibrio sp. ZJ200]|uniref:hypothetical protein n=1 Tax=Desulfovibrio sp. ZJ200 TaxID=2709792 RepID=UPI00197D701B|nr:hypothetical protein [Desulfovibrio sp. ZJ200]
MSKILSVYTTLPGSAELEHFLIENIHFQSLRRHHFASRTRSGRSFGAGVS